VWVNSNTLHERGSGRSGGCGRATVPHFLGQRGVHRFTMCAGEEGTRTHVSTKYRKRSAGVYEPQSSAVANSATRPPLCSLLEPPGAGATCVDEEQLD